MAETNETRYRVALLAAEHVRGIPCGPERTRRLQELLPALMAQVAQSESKNESDDAED